MDEIEAPPFLLEIGESMGAWSSREIPGLLEHLTILGEWHAYLPYVSPDGLTSLAILQAEITERCPPDDPLFLEPYWSSMMALSDMLALRAAVCSLHGATPDGEAA